MAEGGDGQTEEEGVNDGIEVSGDERQRRCQREQTELVQNARHEPDDEQERTPEGLLLTEIAPGADLQRDILEKMEFAPKIADDLREMDGALFAE